MRAINVSLHDLQRSLTAVCNIRVGHV